MSELHPHQTTNTGSRLPDDKCPTCGYHIDSATETINGRRPKPFDISLCAKCGEILQFGADMKLAIPTIAEMLTWPEDTRSQVAFFQTKIREIRPVGVP